MVPAASEGDCAHGAGGAASLSGGFGRSFYCLRGVDRRFGLSFYRFRRFRRALDSVFRRFGRGFDIGVYTVVCHSFTPKI